MSWLSNLDVPAPMAKADYREREQVLRQALLQAQMDLRHAPTAALLVVAGVDGAGKGETVQLLNEWMDPRWIRTHAFDEPSGDETGRPEFWRYWRRLPPRGEIALFLSAWYSQALLARVDGCDDGPLAAALERIRLFEQMLARDGMLIFKLWLHLDAEAQRKRFRELQDDPLQSWRVTPRDLDNCARSHDFTRAADEIIDGTHSDQCRWHVIEGSDGRRRAVQAGDALLVSLRGHLLGQSNGRPRAEQTEADREPLATASLSGSPPSPMASKPDYRDELASLQGKLNGLHRRARAAGVALIGVFEGRDAAGKGGAIRRVVAALDARRVDVVRIGPPTNDELEHHYLWRFWRRMPGPGRVTLFDRSWYGRVLVERVEELATEHEWQRAYEEINDFERQIVGHGTVLVKFWLQIDRDEQKRRFKERERVPHKRWKLTKDDKRNRRLWEPYDDAIAEMLERTSTDAVPWHTVPANDKRHARLEVLRAIVSALEARLSAEPGQELAQAPEREGS